MAAVNNFEFAGAALAIACGLLLRAVFDALW